MKTLLFVVLAFVCSISVAKAAPPTLGADCGAGATIVGSKEAGKVTLGFDPDDNCTLTFSWPGNKVPSCAANLEDDLFVSNPNVNAPASLPTVTTATTLKLALHQLNFSAQQGFVASYLCVGQ